MEELCHDGFPPTEGFFIFHSSFILSKPGDDARYFQISVVQPGNSGGALVDERGNVVGAAVAASRALPENVNYAIKSSYLLSVLESVAEIAAKLKEPNTKEKKFEDVVKSAEQATCSSSFIEVGRGS